MIFLQLKEQLNLLSDLLSTIEDEHYLFPIVHLDNATIGQHTRHIIELLNCALEGKKTGVVDYINRVRDLSIEKNRRLALGMLRQLSGLLHEEDVALSLIAGEDCKSEIVKVKTTFHREIVYNTEHTVHHMALIKVAMLELNLPITDHRFGYASSTLQYKASLSNT